MERGKGRGRNEEGRRRKEEGGMRKEEVKIRERGMLGTSWHCWAGL